MDLLKQHEDVLKEILNANADLRERRITCVQFDPDQDMLAVWLGDSQETITETMNNRVYLNLDPETLRIVWVEIPHVSARLADDPVLAKLLTGLLPRADIMDDLREAVLV